MPHPWLPFVVLVALAGPMAAADPPNPELAAKVAGLVKQLGDDDFDRRQAAQKQLTALGPVVLPVLDRLGPIADPEAAARVRAVRRAVGGLAEEIRAAVEAPFPDAAEPISPPRVLPDGVRKLIVENQPKAGDVLLAIVADPKHPIHRQAVNAVVMTWDTLTPGQANAYFERSLIPYARPRPRYPRGVGAGIEMGYGVRYPHHSGGWPVTTAGTTFRFVATTTHYLDGQEYGKPFRYEDSPGATTGWLKTKDLPVGRHAVRVAVAYEFPHAGKSVKGSVRSEEFAFEVLPEDTPDDLVAPKDPAVDKLVRTALRFAETEEAFQPPMPANFRGFPPGQARDWWEPQVWWRADDGQPTGLHMPVWKLEKPLPVDLCFDVTVRVEGTNEEVEGYPLIVPRGTGVTGAGWFMIRDERKLAAGRSGFVPVRLVLKPSRAAALTRLDVTRYFPGEIVTDVLRAKVGPGKQPPPLPDR